MQALEFWKTLTGDRDGFLECFLGMLRGLGIRYCVIGGQGLNAYAEPVVSLDLDLVVAVTDLWRLRDALPPTLKVREFGCSLYISEPSSRLQIQIQTDSRYSSFVEGAEIHDVLDLQLPVAAIEDLMQGKVWAATDPERRASKRQKDLARLLGSAGFAEQGSGYDPREIALKGRHRLLPESDRSNGFGGNSVGRNCASIGGYAILLDSETFMAYVIAEPCIGTKDTACVDACPVDCIHPKKEDGRFADAEMLYIDPVECIDCGACVPVCPVSAIFALDDLPEKWTEFTKKNAVYFGR